MRAFNIYRVSCNVVLLCILFSVLILYNYIALQSIILDGAKWILGCSSKTCNEVVRGDMGLDTLQSCMDRAK